ncbi:MAG: DUF2249 domain-containing protein [Chloroflexota bacterium]|nr:DUF2249 domain-containing protein [Chloroflexota bacterium]
MDVARAVPVGQQWVLVNTFDPLPLYALLGKQGFEGWATQHGPEEWAVHFFRHTDLDNAGRALRPHPLRRRERLYGHCLAHAAGGI